MNESMSNPFPFTPVKFFWPLPKIPADSILTAIGSCFSEELAGELLDGTFNGAQNPNGILYNPVSIADALEHLTIPYREEDFFEFNGQWHSWLHHGRFAAPTPLETQNRCERARLQFLSAMEQSGIFLLTLSSAVVYELLDNKRIVANCHKVPGNRFLRRMLSRNECEDSIRRSIRAVRMRNENCMVILTLSPVKHYPGELLLNTQSKALLLNAIYNIVPEFDNCAYFPAYEIVTEELRDYRFYSDDMLHPNELARSIVLKRFLDTCFDRDVRNRYETVQQQKRRSRHLVERQS